MIECPRCGRRGTDEVCASCGAPLAPEAEAPVFEQPTFDQPSYVPPAYSLQLRPKVVPDPAESSPSDPDVEPFTGEEDRGERPRFRPRHLRRWIALGAVAAVLIAGAIVTAWKLTRGTDTPADHMVTYATAPTDSVTVTLADMMERAGFAPPFDSDIESMAVLSASPQQVVVYANWGLQGANDGMETHSALVAVDRNGTALWALSPDYLGNETSSAFDGSCAMGSTRIVCAVPTDSGVALASIDSATGTIERSLATHLSNRQFGAVTIVGDDLLLWTDLTKPTDATGTPDTPNAPDTTELHRVDPSTGTTVWTSAPVPVGSNGEPFASVADDNRILVYEQVSDSVTQTEVIDAATGKTLHRFDGLVIVTHGGVWVGPSTIGDTTHIGEGVRAVDDQGRELWSTSDGALLYSTVDASAQVFTTTTDSASGSTLTALDATTGAEQWTSPSLGEPVFGAVCVDERIVALSGESTALLDAATGHVLQNTPGRWLGTAADGFYVSDDQSIASYSLATGERQWQAPLKDLLSYPASSLHVMSASGYLVIIGDEPASVTVLFPNSE